MSQQVIDVNTSPLARQLPDDPIEALQAIRALMEELDAKAKTDDLEGFSQAVQMLFGRDVAEQIGVTVSGFDSDAEAKQALREINNRSASGAEVDPNFHIAMGLNRRRRQHFDLAGRPITHYGD